MNPTANVQCGGRVQAGIQQSLGMLQGAMAAAAGAAPEKVAAGRRYHVAQEWLEQLETRALVERTVHGGDVTAIAHTMQLVEATAEVNSVAMARLREALRVAQAAQGVEEWQRRKALAAKAQRKAAKRAKKKECEYKRQAAERERYLATTVHQPWLLNPKPRTSISPPRRSASPLRGGAATATVAGWGAPPEVRTDWADAAGRETVDVLLEQSRCNVEQTNAINEAEFERWRMTKAAEAEARRVLDERRRFISARPRVSKTAERVATVHRLQKEMGWVST